MALKQSNKSRKKETETVIPVEPPRDNRVHVPRVQQSDTMNPRHVKWAVIGVVVMLVALVIL